MKADFQFVDSLKLRPEDLKPGKTYIDTDGDVLIVLDGEYNKQALFLASGRGGLTDNDLSRPYNMSALDFDARYEEVDCTLVVRKVFKDD